MAKNKKKKGKKKPLRTVEQKPKPYVYREPWRERECNPELIKEIEGLEWHPRRCYIGYDWERSSVCLIFPEPVSGGNMWRYFEFEMHNSRGAHLLWGREIEDILKKAKKAGRKRKVL